MSEPTNEAVAANEVIAANVGVADDAVVDSEFMGPESEESAPQSFLPSDNNDSVFVEATSLEESQDFLFPGDKGSLDYTARRIFALLLQRRFIEASEDKWAWDNILKYQNELESRFHDMFLNLVVDRDYSVAYKTQIREEELNIPILLRDDSYKRAETVILIYLRSAFRQQLALGSRAAFVDHDELANHAMSFFASDETNIALRQKEVKQGIDQLAREGLLKEESPERYRISPIIEVLMPLERINELTAWLQERAASHGQRTETIVYDESDLDAHDGVDGEESHDADVVRDLSDVELDQADVELDQTDVELDQTDGVVHGDVRDLEDEPATEVTDAQLELSPVTEEEN